MDIGSIFMGKADVITNEYMSDNERFADVFNFFLYDGDQVIRPDKLKELDRTSVALPYKHNTRMSDVIQKYRDVFKLLAAMEDDNAAYLLIGIENQTYIHYAMPVKDMLYDAAQYVRQVEKTAKAHRSETKNGNTTATGDKFLSGFHKDDKLLPVITLVIYWSPDEWDGPKSIHEMLSVKDKRILKHVPDYKINLITPKNIDDKDFSKFHTTLAEVFQFIKYSNDDVGLERVVNANSAYEHLDRRTVEVINEVTGSRIDIPDGAKEVNMCLAIKEIERKASEKAAEKTLLESIHNLMKNMKLTAEQAMDALGIVGEDRSRYAKML